MGMNVQETMTSPLVWHPETAVEAWQLKQTYGSEAVYAAGGTLLRTHWESGAVRLPRHLINLSSIHGFNEIRVGEDGLVIGSQATLQACRTNTLLQRQYPMVTEAMRTIAAPSIRHLATVGGNIASVVGDSIPALLVYDASLVWFNGQDEQQEELADWLLAGRQKESKIDRVLLSLRLPLTGSLTEAATDQENNPIPNIKRFYAFHKVGRREAFTPSVVTAAVSGAVNESGKLIDLKIAVGGGQTVACRLEEVEQEVTGAIVDAALLQHVYARTQQCFEPREDVFASRDYRKKTAANLIVTELWKAIGGSTRQGG